MMIMVRRRTLAAYVGICAVLAVAGGYWGWRTVLMVPRQAAKTAAEQLLFGGLVAGIAISGLGIAVLRRSLKMSRILEKIAAMNSLGAFSLHDSFLRLGDVGITLNTIFARISELNEKKSRKVLAMSALVENLLSTVDRPVLVVNASGVIVHASQGLLDAADTTRMALDGRPLVELFKGLDFAEMVRGLSRSGNALSLPLESTTLQIARVVDRAGLVAYAVIELDSAAVKAIRALDAPERSPGAAISKGLGAALSDVWTAVRGRRNR